MNPLQRRASIISLNLCMHIFALGGKELRVGTCRDDSLNKKGPLRTSKAPTSQGTMMESLHVMVRDERSPKHPAIVAGNGGSLESSENPSRSFLVGVGSSSLVPVRSKIKTPSLPGHLHPAKHSKAPKPVEPYTLKPEMPESPQPNPLKALKPSPLEYAAKLHSDGLGVVPDCDQLKKLLEIQFTGLLVLAFSRGWDEIPSL